MISLEEYKNELAEVYYYEIDNDVIKRQSRRSYLEQYYSDEYLEKIISNTYDVIRNIFEISRNSFFTIEMDDDTTTYISLNLTGGYFSDRLFIDAAGNIISEFILKRTFGNKLDVELKIDELDFETNDPDIVSFDYVYSLYLQGFPENMSEIKRKLFGISRINKKE